MASVRRPWIEQRSPHWKHSDGEFPSATWTGSPTSPGGLSGFASSTPGLAWPSGPVRSRWEFPEGAEGAPGPVRLGERDRPVADVQGLPEDLRIARQPGRRWRMYRPIEGSLTPATQRNRSSLTS